MAVQRYDISLQVFAQKLTWYFIGVYIIMGDILCPRNSTIKYEREPQYNETSL